MWPQIYRPAAAAAANESALIVHASDYLRRVNALTGVQCTGRRARGGRLAALAAG